MNDPNAAFDPYRSPASNPDFVESRPYPLAGAWRRFGTYCADIFVYYLVVIVFVLVAMIVGGESAVKPMTEGPGSTLIATGILLGYYLFFESLWSRTPGKWMLGTKVESASGGRPSFGQVLGRTLCRLIPFEPLSLLGKGVGWHDTIPKTRVVYIRGK